MLITYALLNDQIGIPYHTHSVFTQESLYTSIPTFLSNAERFTNRAYL